MLRQAAEALRESEERFRLVLRATNDAIWDINLVTGIIRWNETYEKSFGRPKRANPGNGGLITSIPMIAAAEDRSSSFRLRSVRLEDGTGGSSQRR